MSTHSLNRWSQLESRAFLRCSHIYVCVYVYDVRIYQCKTRVDYGFIKFDTIVKNQMMDTSDRKKKLTDRFEKQVQ